MRKMVKRVGTWALSASLALSVIGLVGPLRTEAASKPKLSKSTVTFASPTAKAQTITIKNLKTSNVKSITINNDWKEWMTIKKKGKNKLVITPKRSSGDITYGVSISIQYKKPVNGYYSDYLSFKKIKIKGSSKIAIKTAADLCNIRGSSYEYHRWQYYLANDIDMTGKGVAKNPGQYGSDVFTGIYLDGKGYSIKSDTPIFHNIGGVVKNVVFDVNMNCTVSKNDAATKIWSEYAYNQTYGGLAPIIYNSGTLENCKATGSITVNLDKEVNYKLSDGTPNHMTDHNIAGLVEMNEGHNGVIKNCVSDVKITVTESNNAGNWICVGGLVAENYGYSGNNGKIIESQFSGNIQIKDSTSFVYAGGIYSWGNGEVRDCLNTGTVIAPGSSLGGGAGIGGQSGSIVERVLTTGNVDVGLHGFTVGENSAANGMLPEYKNAYYLTSKSDGFNWIGNPVEVPGTKGISDAELTDQSTFVGFDFDKVWVMGANGPELRNLPKF